MLTAFGRWLAERGEPAYLYAQRMKMRRGLVYRLAGLYESQAPRALQADLVRKISEDSGIPVGVLCEEAIAAMDEPERPRRKNGG